MCWGRAVRVPPGHVDGHGHDGLRCPPTGDHGTAGSWLLLRGVRLDITDADSEVESRPYAHRLGERHADARRLATEPGEFPRRDVGLELGVAGFEIPPSCRLGHAGEHADQPHNRIAAKCGGTCSGPIPAERVTKGLA